MANNTVTPENVCQNVAVLNEKFEGFAEKQDNLIFKVDRVLEETVPAVRRANKHHETYATDQLEIAKIEPMEKKVEELEKKHPGNDKGGERRGWWKRMSTRNRWLFVMGVFTFIVSNNFKGCVVPAVNTNFVLE